MAFLMSVTLLCAYWIIVPLGVNSSWSRKRKKKTGFKVRNPWVIISVLPLKTSSANLPHGLTCHLFSWKVKAQEFFWNEQGSDSTLLVGNDLRFILPWPFILSLLRDTTLYVTEAPSRHVQWEIKTINLLLTALNYKLKKELACKYQQ